MKIIYNILIILVIILVSCINENSVRVTFLKHKHNFGVVPFRSKCKYVFRFTNNGERPVSVDYINVYCDCVVAKWPKNEILAGENDSIIVCKNTSTPGQFSDLLIVYYKGCKIPDTLKVAGSVMYSLTVP